MILFEICWCKDRATIGLPLLPYGFGPDDDFVRFHFARRFWNQILICTSLRFRLLAMLDLSLSDKYFLL